MIVESVDAPSLLELRAIVDQRLRAYGAFEGCAAEDQHTILAQACMVIWHLTAGEQGRRLYRMHLGSPADGAPSNRQSRSGEDPSVAFKPNPCVAKANKGLMASRACGREACSSRM